MNTSLQFCTLKPSEFDDIFHVIVEANRQSSPMILNKCETIEAFQEETRTYIRHYFQQQERYNKAMGCQIERVYGMKMDGKLVAVGMSIDQTEHEKHVKELLVDEANPYTAFAAVYSTLGLDGIQPGKAAYLGRLSVLPEMRRKGIANRITFEIFRYLLERGYEEGYLGTVVDSVAQMLHKLGAELQGSGDLVGPGFALKIRIFRAILKKSVQLYQSKHP